MNSPEVRAPQIPVAMVGTFLAVGMALLIAGPNYTKFQVLGPISAYDMMIALAGILSLSRPSAALFRPSFLVFATIVLAYVVFSFVARGFGQAVIRQAAMFGYAAIAAVIVSRFAAADRIDGLAGILKAFALSSVLAQLLFGTFLLLSGASFGEEQYHYLSPASVVLNIIAAAIFLGSTSWAVRIWGTLLVFLCLYMSGHSSATLAVLAMVGVILIAPLPAFLRLSIVIAGIIAIPVLVIAMVSSNSKALDVNAMWRFFYWYSVGRQVLLENYGILGFGFGAPYASDATAELLQVTQGYSTTLGQGEESFLSPPHNFYITLPFHVGLLPSLILVFCVLRSVYRLVFSSPSSMLYRYRWLGLSLVGLSVWAGMNVVVELPHAGIFYWLILFSSIVVLYRFRGSVVA